MKLNILLSSLLWLIPALPMLAHNPLPTFSPMDYGATGVGDDTVAVSNCVAAANAANGTVILDRIFGVAQTITVGGDTNGARFVSIVGSNPVTCGLGWRGATNGVCLSVSYNKYFKIEGIGIYNQAGPFMEGVKGSTIGVLMTGPLLSGTQTLGGKYDRVIVRGFDVNMRAGVWSGKATSEIAYFNCNFNLGNTGWQNQDLNTLNHNFYNSGAVQNQNGFDIGSGNANFYGGSVGFNSNSFLIWNAATPVVISGVYSEMDRRFIWHHTVSHSQLLVQGCTIRTPSSTDGISIEVKASRSAITIQNCSVSGKLFVNQRNSQEGFVKLSGVNLPGRSDLPFFWDDAFPPNSGSGVVKYTVEGCAYFDQAGVIPRTNYNDQIGQFKGTKHTVVRTTDKDGKTFYGTTSTFGIP